MTWEGQTPQAAGVMGGGGGGGYRGAGLTRRRAGGCRGGVERRRRRGRRGRCGLPRSAGRTRRGLTGECHGGVERRGRRVCVAVAWWVASGRRADTRDGRGVNGGCRGGVERRRRWEECDRGRFRWTGGWRVESEHGRSSCGTRIAPYGGGHRHDGPGAAGLRPRLAVTGGDPWESRRGAGRQPPTHRDQFWLDPLADCH
jgi:hypothetical protein